MDDARPPAVRPPAETKGGRASHGVVLAIVAGLILLVIAVTTATPPFPTKARVDSAADMMVDNMTVEATPSDAATPSPTASEADSWTYSEDADKLNGGTTYLASTTSTNVIRQAAPYDGGTRMTMTVRRHPRWGSAVYFTISEGQLMCPSYEGCSGMVRFDDGRAHAIRFNGPEDSSSEIIFVEEAGSFFRQLKKARKLVVEKTLYEAGTPQFEFDVAGLRWDH